MGLYNSENLNDPQYRTYVEILAGFENLLNFHFGRTRDARLLFLWKMVKVTLMNVFCGRDLFSLRPLRREI